MFPDGRLNSEQAGGDVQALPHGRHPGEDQGRHSGADLWRRVAIPGEAVQHGEGRADRGQLREGADRQGQFQGWNQ